MARILVATREGLLTIDRDGRRLATDLPERPVTAIVRDGPQLWAILDASEIWHAPDGAWRSVAILDGALATCIAMTNAIHVGTSEARLFRLRNDALEPVAAFDAAAGRETWFTPWGGPPATRSISEWGRDVYVNVHVGGILRTDDDGASWTPTIEIEADVHQVATAEGIVLAATAGGLASSTDRGATWSTRADGLEARYARAAVVCGDRVLVSTSDGPRGGHAAVYRAPLAGGTFERCGDGLPGWFDGNIDTGCLDALNDGSFAAFAAVDGHLYGSEDGGDSWVELTANLPPVNHLLIVPDEGMS
jgi:hypothetical protein